MGNKFQIEQEGKESLGRSEEVVIEEEKGKKKSQIINSPILQLGAQRVQNRKDTDEAKPGKKKSK